MTDTSVPRAVQSGGDGFFADADGRDRKAPTLDRDLAAARGRTTTGGNLAAALTISIKIATVVCVVELLIMLLFSLFPAAPTGPALAVFDAVLLAACSTPPILYWVIRPFIAAREAAASQLTATNEALKNEIGERVLVEEELRTRKYELEVQIDEIGYMKGLMEKQAADAIALAEDLSFQKQAMEASERRNEYLANHDTLTGLPNRRSFERQLSQLKELARARNGTMTLIFVDLDNFKTVNDTLGHMRGDELLVEVAAQLRGSTRDVDLIARLGGDEFAIVSTQFKHGRDAELRSLAERIRRALSIAVEAGGRVIPVSATLGIATYPADAADERKLLQCADRAMYAAKKHGRNRAVFYHDLEAVQAAS